MWKLRACKWLARALALVLYSCPTAPQEGAVPESQQVISDSLKQLYMRCSAAPPHSPAQQQLVRQMADKAANGKELLLVMRAGVGVFPPDEPNGAKVRGIVEGKMMKVGTLNQLIDY